MNPILITKNAASFRTPFYNLLVREHGFRIIVLTTKDGDVANLDKNIEVIPAKSFFGLLYPSKKINLPPTEPIVTIFDLRLFPWVALKIGVARVLFWGIGVGNSKFGNLIRKYLLGKSKGFMSYMPSGLALTRADQSDQNTYLINSVFIPNAKPVWKAGNKLVFLGTVDQRKRLDILVHAINHLSEMGEKWSVTVIGDGPELPRIRRLVSSLSLEEQILFEGRLSTPEEKIAKISNAFLTVLPGQSGLSVLESFAYGIPVLTWENAISGGENDNIVDGVTGFLTRKLCPVQFALTLTSLAKDTKRVELASQMCYRYYSTTASGDTLVRRFVEHIHYLSEQPSAPYNSQLPRNGTK